MKQDESAIKIGLIYDFQVVDELTLNPSDVKLDYVKALIKILGENL